MRKPTRRAETRDLVSEIEAGLADIDRELGMIVYQSVLNPAAQAIASAPESASSLAALISDSVTTLGQQAYAMAVVKPADALASLVSKTDPAAASQDLPGKLTDSRLLALRQAEERSTWERFATTPGVSHVLDKLGAERSEKLAEFMSRRVGAASLLAQFTSVKKLMFSATAAATAFNAGIDTSFGQVIASTWAQVTGMTHQDSESAAGMTLILAAVSARQILATAISYRLHSNHDALKEKIAQWNSGIETGWAGVAKGLMSKGLSMLVTPHPPLAAESRAALQAVAAHGGMLPKLPADDQKSIDAVTNFLTHELRVGTGSASFVAADMLINEEPDPSRLMSLLRSRHLPQAWIEKYGINPGTCVMVRDNLQPQGNPSGSYDMLDDMAASPR